MARFDDGPTKDFLAHYWQIKLIMAQLGCTIRQELTPEFFIIDGETILLNRKQQRDLIKKHLKPKLLKEVCINMATKKKSAVKAKAKAPAKKSAAKKKKK